ncbi:MAG: ferritin-like domain-containing protein [Pseudomonadota bacterium]
MNNSASLDAQKIRVNDREQLIYLLTEAAEIEHGLMCCYLYAAWSLKQSTDEGLSAEQLQKVDAWRKQIHGVAMEEMLHLALVNNLLMSIGSPPHFARQNFPVAPGYHPASLVVRLAPCTRDTISHFVYLERPEGMQLPQAAGFETAVGYRRSAGAARLTPNAEDYDTVGHLYAGIEHGFEQLAGELGEGALFIGAAEAQIDSDLLSFPSMHAVTDLRSALAAIATIVEQGEGSRSDHEKSHYAQFVTIGKQYDAMLAADAGFRPYRPVAPTPVMFRPIANDDATHVSAPDAAVVLDLANACYSLMLRLLASATGGMYEKPFRAVQLGCAIEMMSIVKALAIRLTTMTATADGAHNASMNFHLPRATLALPQRDAGMALLAERAHELAGAARQRDLRGDDGAPIGDRIAAVGMQLAQPV